MQAAIAAGDTATECVTAGAFARALMQRGSEFDQATRLARRALTLGEDPVLREELAGWFSLLGEPALAAATLRPLLGDRTGNDAARLLTRIGMLLARGGEATGAREAYEAAEREALADRHAAELCASIGVWAPEVVTPSDAARFYLIAAERQERSGDRVLAFENLLRAFEVAPESSVASERLARWLFDHGRMAAADEVLREHARRLPTGARGVHLGRLRDALRLMDLPRALGAALDARLDLESDVQAMLSTPSWRESTDRDPSLLSFDELLERTGLSELFAARLELGSDVLSGVDRARVQMALGRLYAALGQLDRADEAWVEALVADPSCSAALRFLVSRFESTGDSTALVEALVRVGEAPSVSAGRVECLRELLVLAERRLGNPSLAHWAALRLSSVESESTSLEETLARIEPNAELARQALDLARVDLEGSNGSDRLAILERIWGLLQGRPDQADLLLSVALELVELSPARASYQRGVERLLSRQGRLDELEAVYERLLSHPASGAEWGRGSLALCHLRRRRGDLDGALAALTPLVATKPLFLAQSLPVAPFCMLLLLAGQRGDESSRARAILRLSIGLSAPVRATLCAVAGELLLRAGHTDEAKAAVDQGVSADPSSARPLAARALVGLSSGDGWAVEAVERSMAVIVPRAAFCSALASAYDELGEPLLALAFSQRRLALRPGDLDAARARLARTLKLGDAERLAEVLSWLLTQPQPLSTLSEEIAAGLRLLVTLDPALGTTVARGALDQLGSRGMEIRLAVLSVADIAGDRELAVAALERWLATGAESSERVEILLDLARRRRASGDTDGSARALLRAVREGAWATAVLAELDIAPPPAGSDGVIALLAARAEALSALSEADQYGTALAWRELGAAYWDLVGDPNRAVRAWERGCVLDLEHGLEGFASDLLAFGGLDLALERLLDFAARRSDPSESARVLERAAAIAFEAGRRPAALAAALEAIARDPRRAQVLTLVEKASTDLDLDRLEGAYDRAAAAALGRQGEWALHLRAARYLEGRGEKARALRHAIRAFEADSTQEAPRGQMIRLASELGEPQRALSVLEKIALSTPDATRRADWLQIAAALPARGVDGLRQKIGIVLHALKLRPDADRLGELAEAVSELLKLSPDDRAGLEVRLERALAALPESLDGPEGARLSIRSARLWLEALGAYEPAVRAVLRAVDCDARVDQYQELEPWVVDFAPYGERVGQRIRELARQRPEAVGPDLLGLGATLYFARGEARDGTELLVSAAERYSELPGLIRRAELSARALGDQVLLGRMLRVIPERDRVQTLLDRAAAAEASGDLGLAQEILQGARSLDLASEQAAARIANALMGCYRRAGQEDRLEELLEERIREVQEIEHRSRLATELAFLVEGRGDSERALTILELALRDAPSNSKLLSDLVSLARKHGDSARQIRGLTRLVELVAEPEPSKRLRGELAELFERSGDFAAASPHWMEVLRIAPRDPAALLALERGAERRGDYEELLNLLERRASVALSPDEVRGIRLRRAAVLEHRLGRPEEARAELENLTASWGDHLSVLRVLADMNERLGDPLRAAPLWLRASAVTTDREEASDLAGRAGQAYLSGGDRGSAERVLDGMLPWATSARFEELARAIAERAADSGVRTETPEAPRSEALQGLGTYEARSVSVADDLPNGAGSDVVSKSSEPPASGEVESNRGTDFPGRYSLRLGEVSAPSSPGSELPSPGSSSSRVLTLSSDEARLYQALASGSIEAGDALIRQLTNRPDRTQDLVSVCRRMSTLLPGELQPLTLLHDAAVADKNPSYALAVQHVIHALQPGHPRIEPPTLDDQVEQPDAVRALLLRDGSSLAVEALSLVWEGAEHLFRRDASTYGVTGLERVPLSAPTPLARAYTLAARSLGMLRTPLFQRRSNGPLTVSLALLSPPAIVLSGDARQDTPELGYLLGRMLVGALPQYVLLTGLLEAQARAALSALAFAFGPPDRASAPGGIPSLAEALWESIPARLQRRLREICVDAGALDYETGVRAARLAARRAGLFVSGDLSVALRETCVEEGVPVATLEHPSGISELCRTSTTVQSLLLLATGAEYAETRWQQGRVLR